MAIKVYGPAKAACLQRVLACFLEKDLHFQIITLDLKSGDHKHPDFLLKQPFGQVPVVEDGDFRLFESRAILRYYAAKYADRGPNLLGKTLEDKALVDQWLEVEAHNFNDLVYNIVLQLVVFPQMGQAGDPKVVQNCEQKLEEVLDIYEQRLATSKYLAGDYFSLADLSHMPAIRYLVDEVGKGHLVRERKKVNGWWEDISSRPAWKKLMELCGY
ncbi:glutathione S-transferase F11 isoform X2 [Jatropha curcas]|uniref:glutathione S-transferase F11 isoform X2 n=1 Tax=Jatropha curcas TaxID=180498 RepID=UPI0005FBCB29|nr:glutathione S-transferase F11 isoform X2 [Jatropha curcas]